MRILVLSAQYAIRPVGSELRVQRILPHRAWSARPSANGILVRRAHLARIRAGGDTLGCRVLTCRTCEATGALDAERPRWAQQARGAARGNASLFRVCSGRAVLTTHPGFGVLVRNAEVTALRRDLGIVPGRANLATVRGKIRKHVLGA